MLFKLYKLKFLMSKKVVFEDPKIQDFNVYESLSFFIAKIINVLQIFLIIFILSFNVINNNGFTYFDRFKNNCEYSYDFSLNRWVFFLFSFNLFDTFLSTDFGREFGNGIATISSLFFTLLI